MTLAQVKLVIKEHNREQKEIQRAQERAARKKPAGGRRKTGKVKHR